MKYFAFLSLVAFGLAACEGSRGPMGPQGPQGERGAEEAQGPQGEQGESIAVNPASMLYWTNSTAGTIQRANPDGSQVQTLVSGLDDPEGIALDMSGGKIYWTESDKVGRANLDGSQVQTLGTETGSDLALDVAQGKMYLANWRGIIYRTGLGGSPVETIVPNAGASEVIALDLEQGQNVLGRLEGR